MLRPKPSQLVAERRYSTFSGDAGARKKDDLLGRAQSVSSSLHIVHVTDLTSAGITRFQ
ncbi:hypothetical protein D3C75_1337400 [compost metagenome]